MAKKSKIIFRVITFGALILLTRCANQLPPGGGEPDTTPPQVLEVYPQNGTINFNKNFFELTFSEYVDKRSVQDAIFISPALHRSLEFDWSGRSLTVYFKDTLKKNTTYTVSIGTDVRDVNNGNKMAEPFTFAFSSGNKIDKGKLTGKVYDPNSDGIMIFAHQSGDNEIDPAQQIPDYISQVGKNGKFTLLGLADGNYKIFAIRDKLRDGKYQKNDDDYGVQFKRIELSDPNNEMNDIDFFMTRDDTISPKIANVLMRNRNHLLVEFTDKIDSTKLTAENFYLFDSTTNKKVLPAYLFKGDAKPYQFYIGLTDTLDKKEDWVLISKGITDFSSNISAEEKNSITVNTDRDTVALKLIKAAGELPGEKVDYEDAKVTLSFNDAIDLQTLKKKLSVQDIKGNLYQFELKRKDDAAFFVLISSKLKQSTEYTVKLDLKNYYDFSGNRVDSLFQHKFTTANELDFSGASGTVTSNDTTQTIVMLESSERIKRTYMRKADEKNIFDFKKVVPGKYIVWSFKDKNQNGKYDSGTIIPFKHSEEFKYYPDTLNLRARWPVGGVNIDF